MFDGRNVFNQPVKINLITFDNLSKIATGLGDDHATGCILDYNYFNNYCKMIAVDLSKQQALDADPKAIQKINFTENLDGDGNITIFLIIEEAKINSFRFATRNCESIVILYCFNIILI